jgi:hypothetical protein
MKFVSTNLQALQKTQQTAFLAFFSVVLVHAPAVAAPADVPAWQLVYARATNAPINCPTETELHIAVAEKLDGTDPFKKDAKRSITVEFVLMGRTVEARVTARNENGITTKNQTLTIPSWRCDLLTERVAFELRDIVAPLELPSTNEPNPTKTPPLEPAIVTPVPPASTTPIAKPPRSAVKPPSTSSTVTVPILGFSFAIGPAWWNAPETALSTTLGADVQWRRFAVGIEGQYDRAWMLPRGGDWRAERVGVLFTACIRHPWSKRFYSRGCGFGTVARFSFDHPLHNPLDGDATTIGIGGRFCTGVWLWSAIGIEARADAEYVLRRPGVRFPENQGWQPAPFTGALRLAFIGVFDVFGAK